jgi:NAD(P)-dependent dehydrogenase (short-subunit alcohol dehydrogenase family)
VVTGGSAGLGLAIAAALTQVGTTVVLASLSAARCAAAAEQLSARTRATVHGRACDVTDERAVGALAEEVLARHGRIDLLVASAGIQARGTLDQLAVQDLRACLKVNVPTAVVCAGVAWWRRSWLPLALGVLGAVASAWW